MEQSGSEQRVSQWRSNTLELKDRIRERLCAAHAHRSLRHSQHPGMVGGAAFRGKRGFAVARVFKGNVVFARLAKRFADKEIWPFKRKIRVSSFREMLSSVGGSHAREQVESLVGTSQKSGLLHEARRQAGVEAKSPFSEGSAALKVLRSIAVPVIGNLCHIFMHGLNFTEVYGMEKLHQALLHRSQGKGLLTVSNHVAAMDDPLVTAALLSPKMLLDEKTLRWTLCATDRCFTSSAKAAFFTCVKVLPVSRGEGIRQKGMDMAVERLDRGDWVHIFPEGSRSRDGGRTIASSKRGVGRLVLDASEIPLIVPFVHDGMQDVMPIGSKFLHVGKRVTVLVGDPIPAEDLVASHKAGELSNTGLYEAVARRVDERMQQLKQELEMLVTHRNLELEEERKHYLSRRGGSVWGQVDWELQGFSVEEIASTGTKMQTKGKTIMSSSSSSNDVEAFPMRSYRSQHYDESFVQSITSRLKLYADPTAFFSFAAKGVALYRA